MSWLDSPARLAWSWSTSMWARSASLPQSSRMLMARGEDFRIALSFSAWERSTPASSPSTRDTRGERLLQRRDQCVGVLAVRELKQKLRVVGRWRLGRNGEPESRSARPDKARHRSQHPLLSAVMLRRLFLHHHLRLADGLFRSRERCVFGQTDVDVGDVEVLTREKLVMEVRREKPAEDQQDRKPRQHIPAMIDRKPDGPAVPTPEPALPPGVDGRLRFRPQQIEGEQRTESHRDQARSD